MKLAMVTGVRRGLGKALVEALGSTGKYRIVGCSRGPHPFLEQKDLNFFYFQTDLSCGQRWLGDFDTMWEKEGEGQNFQEIVLINNAARLEPIGPLEKVAPHQLRNHLELNLITPMLINQWLLQKTQHFRGRVVSVGISSGAATRAYGGWSAYCTSKAANLMMSQCLALEEIQRGKKSLRQFEIWDFNPGVMDTRMQDLIRSKNEETFPHLKKFIQLKDENLLKNPRSVAERLVELLGQPQESGSVQQWDGKV